MCVCGGGGELRRPEVAAVSGGAKATGTALGTKFVSHCVLPCWKAYQRVAAVPVLAEILPPVTNSFH